jgi:hypothetical protein
MALTTTVNTPRTVVHAGSNGISVAFPDVCKTPTPGGPVPIPYANVAFSRHTTRGSRRVKVDGKSIMLKGSKFATSTGDEPGTAGGGVMSNRIKGVAKFANYSFDVKVEGKAVPRLLDPMQQNGNASNAFSPAVLQAAIVVAPNGVITLECDPNWDDCQKQQARAKVAALNASLPRTRRAVDQLTQESKKSWQAKYHRDFKKTKTRGWPPFSDPVKQPSQYYDPCAQTNGKSLDADHIVDAQWSGRAMGPFRMLDSSVNQRLGSMMSQGPNNSVTVATYFDLHCP